MKKLVILSIIAVLIMSSLPAVLGQDDEIVINFSHAFADENRQGLVQDVIARFEAENPGIKINAEAGASYREVLNGALLAAEQDAASAPHIVQVFEVGTQLALDSGIFVPVSSVASEEELVDLEDVIGPVLNYYTVGEDVWSLPWNSSNPILYYNMEMFEAAGIENPPETYGEVLAVCETLMGMADELGIQGCMGWPMHSWMVEQWVAEQGALLVDNDNGRTARATEALLDSEAMLNIFTWWKDMADNDYYLYTGALEDWNGSDAIFTGQQAAMHITSTADLVNITEAGAEAGFSVGTGLLPIADGAERNGTVVGGASIWLTSGHPQEEMEAAVKFMIYLGNTQSMVDWHRGNGYFPLRYSSIEQLEAEGWFEENPTFTTAFDQMTETQTNYATGGALMGTFLETRTIIENAAQLVVDQGVDPAEALAEADALADEALEFYNLDYE